MTTELEEQFFKAFGIEKKCVRGCGEYYFEKGNIDAWSEYDCKNSDCSKCEHDKSIWEYPEITDRKLLEMICILNDYEGINVKGTTIEELKEELLSQCIEYFKYPIAFEESADLCNLHNQIQQLFKEGE